MTFGQVVTEFAQTFGRIVTEVAQTFGRFVAEVAQTFGRAIDVFFKSTHIKVFSYHE